MGEEIEDNVYYSIYIDFIKHFSIATFPLTLQNFQHEGQAFTSKA
jgi:hypothetical protein